MSLPDDDWRPAATLEVLRQRSRLLAAVRGFFEARGYWEVETPLLSRDVCVDPWINPLPVPDPAHPHQRLYLQTSPEFAMKRLLATGAEAIFEITRSFRGGESGRRHNREFTIVEWYRAGTTWNDQATLVEELMRHVATCSLPGASPAPALPQGRFPRYSYDVAARDALGTTLLDKSTDQLVALARELHVSAPASLPPSDRDGWLNLLLAERIEPWLATQPACFLHDYPPTQAALARIRRGVPEVAERFELYLGGIELCNGYQELTDADELAARMIRHNALRTAAGAEPLPVTSRLIDAMRSGLPECAGVALGFDRLVQWRLGAADLRAVLAFPDDRA